MGYLLAAYYAGEPTDKDGIYYQPKLTKSFDIERIFEVSDKFGARKRSIQISIDNRDLSLNAAHATYSLLNKKVILEHEDSQGNIKSFHGVITEINSFGLDVEVTVSEELSLYMQQPIPDAQVAQDYYSDTGINENWNACPICIGTVNRLKIPWVDNVFHRFMIGSGPLASIDKIYFDKVIMYDKTRTAAENLFFLTDESKKIGVIIWSGTGWGSDLESQVHPTTGDTIYSVYPGFAYVEFYDATIPTDELTYGQPIAPMNADGSVPELFVDVQGITGTRVGHTTTAERNPAAILYQLATNPLTCNSDIKNLDPLQKGARGFGLAIPTTKIDFTAAITYCDTNALLIDGVIAQRSDASEWFDELAKYAMSTFVEIDGVLTLVVDEVCETVEAYFSDTGTPVDVDVTVYECVVGDFQEPGYDKQINRVRLSYAYNIENGKFDKKPSGDQESPLITGTSGTPPNEVYVFANSELLRNEDHYDKILKWNTGTFEYKFVSDDETAHRIAVYNFNRDILELQTVDLSVESTIPSTLDVKSLIAITSSKHGWNQKEFKITKMVKSDKGARISCKEYYDEVYVFENFVAGSEETQIEYPQTPRPYKPVLTSITLTNDVRVDKTVHLLDVVVTKPSDNCLDIILYYKLSSETVFKYLDRSTTGIFHIEWPYADGAYNFRVCSASPLGTISSKDIKTPVGTEYHYYYGQTSYTTPSTTETTFAIADSVTPPATVANFRSYQDGNMVDLNWDANSELDVIEYEIREGADWDTANRIALHVTTTSYSYKAGTDRLYQFMIKAINRIKIYSTTPATSDIEVSHIELPNVVVDLNEFVLCDGTHTNTEFVASEKRWQDLTTTKWSDLTTYRWMDLPKVKLMLSDGESDGEYVTTIHDLGKIMLSNVYSHLDGWVYLGVNTYATWIRTSTDMTNWTAWKLLVDGESLKFQGIQFKLVLHTDNVMITPEVYEFRVTVDVPDVVKSGTVTIPISGSLGFNISYGYNFNAVPYVISSAITGLRHVHINSKTKTTFNVTVVDKDNIEVGGIIDFICKGY